jgi:uncharacterized membrane protein YqiK
MTKNTAAEPTTATPAESTTVEPVTVEPVSTPPAEPAKDAAWWEGKAKAMEAEKVANAKKLAKLEAAEQARQEAEQTELQKAQARAEKAEAEANEAKLAVLRRDAITNTGLPAAFADRLKGNTLEEMEADAKLLLAAIPAPVKPVPPAVGATNPGAPGTGETEAERKKRLIG